jgi:hypothetical protein
MQQYTSSVHNILTISTLPFPAIESNKEGLPAKEKGERERSG